MDVNSINRAIFIEKKHTNSINLRNINRLLQNNEIKKLISNKKREMFSSCIMTEFSQTTTSLLVFSCSYFGQR